MAQESLLPELVRVAGAEDDTSHLANQIEGILSSPADFTASTPQEILFPLLNRLRQRVHHLQDAATQGRVAQLEVWCKQLEDASRAAFARNKIVRHLTELETWEDWQWSFPVEEIQRRKVRVEEISLEIAELPIEWLKTRVTGKCP